MNELKATNYSIHFHVWSEASFRDFLHRLVADLHLPMNIAAFVPDTREARGEYLRPPQSRTGVRSSRVDIEARAGSPEVDPIAGTKDSRNQGVEAPAVSVLFLFEKSSSRFLLFFLSLLWVCGQRVCVVQAKRHIHSFSRSLRRCHAVAPHVYWLLVAHGLMRPTVVVEVYPSADAGPRLAAVGVAFRWTSSYLIERHSRSMKMLSMKRPRPSIEIAISAASSLP